MASRVKSAEAELGDMSPAPATSLPARQEKRPGVDRARNAAIDHARDASDTSRSQLMGRHVAGASFLRGFARFADVDTFYCHARTDDDFADFSNRINGARGAAAKCVRVSTQSLLTADGPACLFRSGPDIHTLAWSRRYTDPRNTSLCGLTHTISSEGAMDAIGALLVAPVQSWDALICTSRAVKASVLHVLENWGDYLNQRLNAKCRSVVQLPIIPLGVDTEFFANAAANGAARKQWRDELGIAETDIAVLFVGRLSYHAKAHPAAMYAALEEASKRTKRRIHLVEAGWYANTTLERAFHDLGATFAPSIHRVFVDGRRPEVGRTIWSLADIFVSLSDNIQESFGLTPLEAMAAGVPVVATDWDGYRDTVRDGVDGILVPTMMAPRGTGESIANRWHSKSDSYDSYIGNVSQITAVDTDATRDAFLRLIEDDVLRRTMGHAGQTRARETFDWAVVIAAYQDLWSELGRRRRADSERGTRRAGRPVHPLRDDPTSVFAGYPSLTLRRDTALLVRDGASRDRLAEIKSIYANNFAAKFLLSPEATEKLFGDIDQSGSTTLGALIDAAPPAERGAVQRTVVWMLKFGLLRARLAP